MLELYGHPFSSYTWKVSIALYANDTPFAFRHLHAGDDEADARVARASPAGLMPLLVDDGREVFESTSIIEYLDLKHPGPVRFLPADPEAALDMRTLDRVFDNYVMASVQAIVSAYIVAADSAPDPAIIARAETRLERTYRWLEQWLEREGEPPPTVTLLTCAAAPSLFYADWLCPIAPHAPRLAAWRGSLLALPEVRRCIDDARPYRHLFPPGAPERD